jgi:hypothetical protein
VNYPLNWGCTTGWLSVLSLLLVINFVLAVEKACLIAFIFWAACTPESD